jgi:hypothetical protein
LEKSGVLLNRRVDLLVNYENRRVDLPVNYEIRRVDLPVNYEIRRVDLPVNSKTTRTSFFQYNDEDFVFPGYETMGMSFLRKVIHKCG